jgi:hypothetical protein
MEFCLPSYRNFRRRTFVHPSGQKPGEKPFSLLCPSVSGQSAILFSEADRRGSRLFFIISTPVPSTFS